MSEVMKALYEARDKFLAQWKHAPDVIIMSEETRDRISGSVLKQPQGLAFASIVVPGYKPSIVFDMRIRLDQALAVGRVLVTSEYNIDADGELHNDKKVVRVDVVLE